MNGTPALYHRNTGFAEKRTPTEVTILGYVWGRHPDGADYGRDAEVVLAVYCDLDGRLSCAPIRDFEALRRQMP